VISSMEKSGQKKVMTPVFLSWSTPVGEEDDSPRWCFIRGVVSYLHDELGFLPVTCNVNVRDDDNPLKSIKRNMESCCGFLGLALGKLFVQSGTRHRDYADIGEFKTERFENRWVTSPFIHIEAAMAYQAGIPVRVVREKNILDDGVLDDNVLPRENKMDIDISDDWFTSQAYFESDAWRGKMAGWATKVRQVRNGDHYHQEW
jgi:hypothetical protein